MENENKKLYTIKKVCDMFGICKTTLKNWENKGIITPIRIGWRKDRRYSEDEINKLTENLKNIPTPSYPSNLHKSTKK